MVSGLFRLGSKQVRLVIIRLLKYSLQGRERYLSGFSSSLLLW